MGIILCCVGLMKPSQVHNKGSTGECHNIPVPTFMHTDRPTITDVLEACRYYNVFYPEVVVAQSLLETGYYTSRVCKNYNNILGLYNSYKGDYFKFDHWSESIKGYVTLVQYKIGEECSEEEYYKFLKELPYATDPNYISKVRKLVRKHFSSPNW